MDIQSIPEIFHSDIKEINNTLGQFKFQLEDLETQIIDFRTDQKRNKAIANFVFGVAGDKMIEYVENEYSIKAERTRPLLKLIRNQKHDPDLPISLTNKFNSILEKLHNLLSISSELTKSSKQNSQKLLSKLNRILEVQKITTKISRAKTQIDVLVNMAIVFNASLPIKKTRKIKPKTKKKVKKSKIKISEEEKKGSNKLFDRLRRFVVFHTKLVYSALFTLAVVLVVGYFGIF